MYVCTWYSFLLRRRYEYRTSTITSTSTSLELTYYYYYYYYHYYQYYNQKQQLCGRHFICPRPRVDESDFAQFDNAFGNERFHFAAVAESIGW